MANIPNPQDAAEAEHYLEAAILKFSDEARHPSERGTPNPDPTWKPRLSTLRYSPLRHGGWIWVMTADDQQVVAYYVTPLGEEPFGRVTAHGQARHNFQELLKSRRIYPTASPYREWYDFSTQHRLDNTLWEGR